MPSGIATNKSHTHTHRHPSHLTNVSMDLKKYYWSIYTLYTHSAMSSGMAFRPPMYPASISSSSLSASPSWREAPVTEAPPAAPLRDLAEVRRFILDLELPLRLPRAMLPPMLWSTSSSSSMPSPAAGACGAFPWGEPGRSCRRLPLLNEKKSIY